MKKLRNDGYYFDNVFPNDNWTLQDFKDFFIMIDGGYLVQDCSTTSFIINEEWEGEDIYKIEFEEDEEELKSYNGVMLPKYVNGREVISYPNAGYNEEENKKRFAKWRANGGKGLPPLSCYCEEDEKPKN